MLRVDTKEQNSALKEEADEVAILRYVGEGGEPFSFDAEVHCESGQVLTYEIKRGYDAVASFEKLDRQAGPCDGIIVQGWNRRAWVLAGRNPTIIDNAEKRLWRIAHSKAVIHTADHEATVRFLRYVERRREPIEVMMAAESD